MGLPCLLGTPPGEKWSGERLIVGSSDTKAWEWDWGDGWGKHGDGTPGVVLSWVWGLGRGQHGEKPDRLGSRTPGLGTGGWP